MCLCVYMFIYIYICVYIYIAIQNASITKKYFLEQKIRLLDHPACYPDLNPTENWWGLID